MILTRDHVPFSVILETFSSSLLTPPQGMQRNRRKPVDAELRHRYPMSVTLTAPSRPMIRVRGRSFIALALTPEAPMQDWLAELDQQVARAPGFFAGKPVVLDLSAAPLHGPGLRAFVQEMRRRNIRVLGLEGIEPEALGEHVADLPPILSGGRPGGTMESPTEIAARSERENERERELKAAREEPASLLLDQPVRSGQSIHFLRGDVTVVGSVSSGAEIVAGGSIHVYGTLRGRAFAGISGDSSARIFCHRLDAELLAITGAYATPDTLGADLRNKPVQAWFDGQSIALALSAKHSFFGAGGG